VKQKGTLDPFLSQNQQDNKIFLLNGKNRLLFLCSLKEKQKKELHIAPAHNFQVRFFFDNQGQRRSLAKRNLFRAAFEKSK